MANEVTFIVKVEGKNVSIVQKQTDKLAKSTGDVDKAQKKATQSGNKFHKLQKGVGQLGANNTKNFSKMNQTMGGSSGLVAAYATLAANVFAATAAFGALQRAAEFENLKKGLHELGQQSGRTLSILADGLRDITGGALSAEEAMRGAAVGISGGFGGKELEGLAKIAIGAAITLGRNLPDAFDRLTRGAIKLEPEILDELGIMVRVDEAAENYAATIGKTANSLTMMEKRQAFMNAILEQGESKFGEIAEAVDPDPYTKLAATFADLTKGIFSFINETLMLGNVAEFLSENITILAGVMVLFGSTIAAKMLPFLADGAAAAHAQAEKMALLAEATLEAGEAQKVMAIGKLGAAGPDVLSAGYIKQAKAMKESGASMEELKTLQRSLNGQLGHYGSKIKMGEALSSSANKQRLVGLELEKASLANVIAMEQGRNIEMLKFFKLKASSNYAESAAFAIQNYTTGVHGLGDAYKSINKGFGEYVKTVDKAKEAMQDMPLTWTQKAMTRLGGATKWVGKQFRLLGAAIMKAIVPIAIIVIAIGAAVAIWDMFWNTKEQKAYNEGMKELDTLLGEIEEKVQKMHKAMNNTINLADGQNRAFEIQSGLLTELVDKMKELIKLREEANKSRPGGDDDANRGLGGFRRFMQTTMPGGVHRGRGFREEMSDVFDDGSGNFAFGRGGFQQLLAVKDSPELKATIGVMTSQIPGAAKLMKEKTEKVLSAPFVSAKHTADELAKAVKQVEGAYANLGPASSSLRQSFTELEKESSKFLSTFAKKTSVDKFVQAFESTDKALKEFTTTVKDDASMEQWAESVGIALLDVNQKTAMLIGPAFVKAQDDVDKLRKKVKELELESGKTLMELREDDHSIVKDLDEALVRLHDQVPLYEKISADVKQIQQMELSRKVIITEINKVMKFLSKNYKINTRLAGIENKLLLQRLRMEREIVNIKTDLLKQEFKTIKKMEKITIDLAGLGFPTPFDLEVVTKEVELTKFLNMLYRDQNDLVSENGLTQERLNALRANHYELEVRAIRIREVAMKQEAVAQQQKAEALLEEIAMAEKLSKAKQKIVETELKLLNYRTRGTTDLDAGDQARLKVQAAIKERDFALQKLSKEQDIIDAKATMQKMEMKILNAQIDLANKQSLNLFSQEKGNENLSPTELKKKFEGTDKFIKRFSEDDIKILDTAIDNMATSSKELLIENAKQLGLNVELAVSEGLVNVTEAIRSGEIDPGKAIGDQIWLALQRKTKPVDSAGAIIDPVAAGMPVESKEEKEAREKKEAQTTRQDRMNQFSGVMGGFAAELEGISEEGAGMSQFIMGMDSMAQSMVALKNGGDKLEGIKGILTGVGQAIAGQAKAAAAAIDEQIKAEEKRDGKSKESVQKIKQLEMKKYKIQKKAFEQNKKISLANAVVSGAQAIQNAFKMDPWPLGLAMGIMATAMTMMQIKAIKNTTFGGTPPDMGASASNTALNIGKRGSSVDVSRGATGGELGYLRGQRGYGTSASNWRPTGGAAGLRRGYAAGGDILVGETGPEVITADEMGYNVIPNDRLGGRASNVSFTINAVDAAGVEEVLLRQRGHIIGMIREAANDNGERFLEQVDTQVYTSETGGG